MDISAVPLVYNGVMFRSTLEADWAATLDALGVYWQYEPLALRLPSGAVYVPDFYLPALNAWAEVKGPHWERLAKPVELRATLAIAGGAGWWEQVHVIVLEAPGPGDAASWHVPVGSCWLVECGERQNRFAWYDGRCWACQQEELGGSHFFYRPARASVAGPTWRMTRAARPEPLRRAA
ncbi:hypothetical protein [Herbidospora sp. NBRC 101105]|uniref:hypothetical protein n=1 Tax=Herbidospora sp. NBRC 101105 TaxID=3032195 RepID=UPI0024A1D0B0|nr:hypothetical protein [Herbidospora sp. NBRC 101105]GLX94565.1 hypothetical protein Hesp01_25150 [Herbidospora sp. NBRC 101105]